jgi:tetratricopeptide (TPR) repeat protein
MVMLAAKLILAASMAVPLSPQAASHTASDEMASHAQRAHEAEQQGDFSTAVREYEYLALQLPRSAEVQSNLGVALYFNHQWEQSIAVLHKAIALNGNLLAPHLFCGLAWYQLSRPDAAVPELETAVSLRSSDVIAHTWLGYAHVAQTHYEAAVKDFEEVTHLAPDNIDAWYALGQAWLEIGRQRTLALLKAVPNGARAWQLAGEQLQLQGDRSKALADFEQANARRPDIPDLRIAVEELGGKPVTTAVTKTSANTQEDTLYAQAHDAEQNSRAAFEHVLSAAPDSYRSHQIMADALVLQRQDDKAIAEYRAVLASKPDLPGIHEAIGSALLRSGRSTEALTEFQAELQLQPRSASVHTLLGQTQLLLGKNDEAEKSLRSALLMDRPPADVWRLLGKLELHRSNYQAAVHDLTHYLAVEKNDATAWYLLSRAYRAVGDKEQMNRALAQFAKVSEDAKARSHAEGELARLNDTHIDEETTTKDSP